MGRLGQFRTFGALTSVVMAIVLALTLLVLSEGVSQAARPGGDTTPPTVGTVVPANNATGVAVNSNVEATFSEAMNASTINGSTFTLAKAGTTTPVAAQVTYDPATNKATLDPNVDLDPGATYTATLRGGNKGVKDLAGNWLRDNRTWSFTTAAAPPPPDTTPPDTNIDSGPSATVSSTSGSASFAFSSSEANSTFECSLDDVAYSGCASPTDYSGLADGSHTFYVRATDAAGNVDPTPASRTWMIDTTSPPPSTGCPNGQFLAEYHNNMTLSGSPAIKRCEASINNTWGAGGPDAGVGTDNFSVRWSGMHTFETGDYLFTATSDDGIRVWVDGQLIIDGWGDHPPTTYRATPTMTAGDHQVRVEYYENSGGATAQLSWQMLGPKVVALTFDDGPDPANTPKILDTLQQHNVKATFFVLGHWVTQYPDLVRREFQEGHVVGNHSYSHNNLTTLSAAEVEQDLRMTNQAITAAGVPQPNLFRPPGGITNGAVESTVSSLGMTQTLWAVDAYDTVNPVPSTELCDRVVSGVSPGSIVVMHDGGSLYTADALDCIITRLKAQGYTFAQVYPSSTYNSLNSSYVEIR